MNEVLRIVLSVIAVGTWSYIIIVKFKSIVEKSVEKGISRYFDEHNIKVAK